MKKTIATILILISLVLSFTGCEYLGLKNDNDPEGICMIPVGLSDIFRSAEGDASFIRAKDFNVLPGVYYEIDSLGNKNRFLLMSCTVTNDCYEMIEDGTEIVFKVTLDVYDGDEKKYIAPAMVAQLFSSFTCYYIFVPGTLIDSATYNSYYYNESITVSNIARDSLGITNYNIGGVHYIIPISGRQVDFNTYDKILIEHDFKSVREYGGRARYDGYNDWFYQGLYEVDLARDIVRLREAGFSLRK